MRRRGDARALCARLGLLGLVIVSTSTTRAHAQGNDLLAPAGGRSALMGGTGVALGRDGAAPFYNPATIVGIRDQRLAFSVNFYSLDLIHFSRFHQPSSVDSSAFGDAMLDRTGLLVSTFRVLPSTLCLFFTLNDLAKLSGAEPADGPSEPMPRSKLAICFASLESEDVDLQAIRFTGTTGAGATSQVQSLQRRWNRTYVGPTYSTHLSDAIAIGGSLQIAYSYSSFGIDGTSLSDRLGGGSIASALGTSGSGFSFELTAVLGATYHADNFSLGVSLRVPSLHLLGVYDGTLNRSTSGADDDAALTINAHGALRSSAPMRAAIGGGFVWNHLTVELDAA
ncbi:MAG TPA: hypothetical protein VGI70_10600, partial [Polyangiales bacterium]